jgi:arginine exporter protein ArgO
VSAMWDALLDLLAAIFSPPSGDGRRWRVLYVVLAVVATAVAVVLVLRGWPG